MGNGGREHALLWKLHRDAPQAEFFVTRPNGGMAGQCRSVDVTPTDVDAVSQWAAAHEIDLTVVGPEAPLADGLVDRLEARGLAAFGPSADAARIESSKAYAKALMEGAGIPTAGHRSFTELESAKAWVRQHGAPIVVKASGLAAGKGAVVCLTEAEALDALDAMMAEGSFGAAGDEVVVEEYMDGEELSVFALTDGERFVLLEPSQDHKRVGEGDTGPNTGGMGAYAPVSLADDAVIGEAADQIIAPTLAALAADGSRFRGLLYAGLMKTPEGLKVVEFNCRFGDPQTQAVLPLMDEALLPLMERVARGERLENGHARSRRGAAVTTVVASGGYPGAYEKGKTIRIPADLETEHTMVFHAGTRLDGDRLVTSGGRVLSVTALAPTFAEAADRSRQGAGRIGFEGAFHRGDIGWRERQRTEGA